MTTAKPENEFASDFSEWNDEDVSGLELTVGVGALFGADGDAPKDSSEATRLYLAFPWMIENEKGPLWSVSLDEVFDYTLEVATECEQPWSGIGVNREYFALLRDDLRKQADKIEAWLNRAK